MSEIVIILGAGASKHAGAPLMLDFLDVADELRRQPTNNLEGYAENFTSVFQAIEQLQRVHAKT